MALLVALQCSLAFAMDAPPSPQRQIQQAVFHTIGNHEHELTQLQRENATHARRQLKQLTARMNENTQQTPALSLERAAALAKEKIQRATADGAQDRRISSLDQRLAAIIAENQRNAADNRRLREGLERQETIISTVALVAAGVAIFSAGVLATNSRLTALEKKSDATTGALSRAAGKQLTYDPNLGYTYDTVKRSGHHHFYKHTWILGATDADSDKLVSKIRADLPNPESNIVANKKPIDSPKPESNKVLDKTQCDCPKPEEYNSSIADVYNGLC